MTFPKRVPLSQALPGDLIWHGQWLAVRWVRQDRGRTVVSTRSADGVVDWFEAAPGARRWVKRMAAFDFTGAPT